MKLMNNIDKEEKKETKRKKRNKIDVKKSI